MRRPGRRGALARVAGEPALRRSRGERAPAGFLRRSPASRERHGQDYPHPLVVADVSAKTNRKGEKVCWGGKLRVVAPLLALVLCGCSSLPRAWVRPDGGPIDSAQFQLDDRYCRGQAENAAVQGARTSTINSPLGADPQDRTAYIGCMADSGYAAAQEQGTGPAVAADASPPAGR